MLIYASYYICILFEQEITKIQIFDYELKCYAFSCV
jgi:hypothetical protein